MLVRWNNLDGEFDNLFRSLAHRDVALPHRAFQTQALVAPADVIETESGFEVSLDLPGYDPKSIDVKLENDTLSISAERKPEGRSDKDLWLRSERLNGSVARSFVLPSNVDATKVEARYENGVLTVGMPKREEAKPRTIQVKVG